LISYLERFLFFAYKRLKRAPRLQETQISHSDKERPKSKMQQLIHAKVQCIHKGGDRRPTQVGKTITDPEVESIYKVAIVSMRMPIQSWKRFIFRQEANIAEPMADHRVRWDVAP
jgi:hypothetical protein